MTTFETAVRLKYAGFPQPPPEGKQIWYDRFGVGRFVVGQRGGLTDLFNLNTNATSVISSPSFWDDAAYAPTVDDLFLAIEELCGDRFGLLPVLLRGRTGRAFRATNATKYRTDGATSEEALAEYWLALKQKWPKGITANADPYEG